MQNFKTWLIFFVGFSFGALIWGIGLFFLQKAPIFYISNYKEYSFYPINLTRIFFNTYKKEKSQPIETLNGVELKALYYNGKIGFVVLKDKKTVFVDLGKAYKGYKLIQIGLNYAIFERNGKKYKLTMSKEKIKNLKIKSVNAFNEQPIEVSRKIFEEYKNNLNKIWNNIGIIKTKDGYEITYIKPGSIFDKLGLRIGDKIIEVNGRKLKNDADAWDLYKNADNFNYFEIKIKRNNKIKVLSYEMD